MTEKKNFPDNSKEQGSSGLSLVDTDFETGSIADIKIESEKSIAPPNAPLSFELHDAEGSAQIKSDSASQLAETPLEESSQSDPYSIDIVESDLSTKLFEEVPSLDFTHKETAKSKDIDPIEPLDESTSKTQKAAFAQKKESLPQASTENKEPATRQSKNKVAILAAVAVLVICGLAFVFLGSGEESSSPDSVKSSQIEQLLKQQDSIINKKAEKPQEVEEIAEPTYWSGEYKDEHLSFAATLTLVKTRVTEITLLFREAEPARLTPKQIVDKTPEPIWLDRFELTEQTAEKQFDLSSFTMSGLAYLKQRNSKTPSMRTVATAKFSGAFDKVNETLVLDWEISRSPSSSNSTDTNSLEYSNKLTLKPVTKEN